MENLFGGADLASGYATARPPVHPEVIARFRQQHRSHYGVTLDVGCGAGLSTRANAPLSGHAIGLEPAEAMLRNARQLADGASFVVGRGEGLPFASAAIDLITAAGSLNYTPGLSAFFGEARRVLKPGAPLLVYDFSQGRNEALKGWFEEFTARYPKARDHAVYLDPETLAERAAGVFQPHRHEKFRIPIDLDAEFYVNYMMTETNVADAVRRGVAAASEIREWCRSTLTPIFQGAKQTILFDGYWAVLA